MDRLEVHAETLQSRYQHLQKAIETADLPQAVADTRRQGLVLLVADSDLVLEACHHLVAETGQLREDIAQRLAGGERASGPVRPTRVGQAYTPTRAPGQRAEGVGVRLQQEVGRPGVDAVLLVVGDRHVDRIQAQP